MSDRLTIEQRHNNMADCAYTQGVTLGQELLGLQPVRGKVSKVPLHRPCGTSRVSYRSFLLWISSLCSHLLAQIHNKNLRQGDNPLEDLLWSGPGNCGGFQFPSSGARWFRACRGLFLRPNCFVHWPNIHLGNWSQFCKLIFFIETYCAIIRGMPSSYSQEDATGISLVSSHRSYFFN